MKISNNRHYFDWHVWLNFFHDLQIWWFVVKISVLCIFELWTCDAQKHSDCSQNLKDRSNDATWCWSWWWIIISSLITKTIILLMNILIKLIPSNNDNVNETYNDDNFTFCRFDRWQFLQIWHFPLFRSYDNDSMMIW